MKSSLVRTVAVASSVVAIAACHRNVQVVSSSPSPVGTGATTSAAPAKAAGLPSDITPAMVDSGKVLFAGRCQRCHGPGGAGGNNGPALNDDKWNQPTVNGSYESILAIIHSGVPQANIQGGFTIAMRPNGGGQYSDDQVRMIAAYVYSLSHK
jgi:mono/diheme cytochrome c family protein